LTVGGGVRATQDVRRLLNAGADKVSMNSSAVANPDLVSEASAHYGSQCIVVAIDAKQTAPKRWEVFTHGGRKNTGLDAIQWAKEVAKRGAGEILLTSMDRDGTKDGFDLELTAAVSSAVSVDLVDEIKIERADAELAASIFHYGQHTMQEAKQYMAGHGVAVRI